MSLTFITSVIELKLDVDTMFEWQKHSQSSSGPPCKTCSTLSIFRLKPLKTSLSVSSKKQPKSDLPPTRKSFPHSKASFAMNSDTSNGYCVLCPFERHPLYIPSMSHNDKHSTLKRHNLCMSCLGSGHFIYHGQTVQIFSKKV